MITKEGMWIVAVVFIVALVGVIFLARAESERSVNWAVSSRLSNQTMSSSYEISEPSVAFSGLDEISLKQGMHGDFQLIVKNIGRVFFNECRIRVGGNMASWIANEQVKGLSPGEKFKYLIRVSIPESAEAGEYTADLVFTCDEGEVIKKVPLRVYKDSLVIKMENYERVGNKLKVSYIVGEYEGKDRIVKLDYSLVDFDRVARVRGEKEFFLRDSELNYSQIVIDLPKDSFGEFSLVLGVMDSSASAQIEEDIFLPSRGVNGMVVSEINLNEIDENKPIILGAIVLLSAVILFAKKMRSSLSRGSKIFHKGNDWAFIKNALER